jgi:hypothetical protein
MAAQQVRDGDRLGGDTHAAVQAANANPTHTIPVISPATAPAHNPGSASNNAPATVTPGLSAALLATLANQLGTRAPVNHDRDAVKLTIRVPDKFTDECIRKQRDAEVFLDDYHKAMLAAKKDPVYWLSNYLDGSLRKPWYDNFMKQHKQKHGRDPAWEEVREDFLRVVGTHLKDKRRDALDKLIAQNRIRMQHGKLEEYCVAFRSAVIDIGSGFDPDILVRLYVEGLTVELISQMGTTKNGTSWQTWEEAEKAAIDAQRALNQIARIQGKPRAAPVQAQAQYQQALLENLQANLSMPQPMNIDGAAGSESRAPAGGAQQAPAQAAPHWQYIRQYIDGTLAVH